MLGLAGAPSSPRLHAAAVTTVGGPASAAVSAATDPVSRIAPNANAASAAIIESGSLTNRRTTPALAVIPFCATVLTADARTNGVAERSAWSTAMVSIRRVSAIRSNVAKSVTSSLDNRVVSTSAGADRAGAQPEHAAAIRQSATNRVTACRTEVLCCGIGRPLHEVSNFRRQRTRLSFRVERHEKGPRGRQAVTRRRTLDQV